MGGHRNHDKPGRESPDRPARPDDAAPPPAPPAPPDGSDDAQEAPPPAFRDVIDECEGELIDEEDRLDRAGQERIAPSDRAVEFVPADGQAHDLPADARAGKVIAVHGDHFRVATDPRDGRETFVVFLPRKLLIRERRYRHPVAVGDDVFILPQPTEGAEPQAHLLAIRERRSWLSRPAPKHMKRRRTAYRDEMEQVVVANVDQVVVVLAASAEIAEVRTNLIDRFLVAAERGGMQPVVIFNKADLIPDVLRDDYDEVLALYRGLGYRAGLTSVTTRQGIQQLAMWLHDRTTVFAGPSGVGKSSLLNAVQPGLELRVGDVNRRTGRGRHTTTTVHLLPLEIGGYVVDTPGIREFGLHELDPADVYKFFPEIEAAAAHCQFRDCSHTGSERGCAVVEALEDGQISDRRYDSFLALRDSLAKERG